jgi:hypothetical protein
MVGGKGTDQPDVCGTGKGGFNGGGNSPGAPQICPGSGGGGASDVRIGGTDLAHRVLVAGGGGGAGNVIFCTDAGAGGGLTGGSAACTPAGGSGGNQDGSSGSGLLGQGGNGEDASGPGSGGGGGYYGGAGGLADSDAGGFGGGGGSGFGPVGTIFQNGVRQGHGRIVITYFVDPVYVTSISPNSGPAAGGTLVTFTGVGFSTDPEAMTFFFGPVLASPSALNIQCQSSTRCTGVTPPGTGTVEVQPMIFPNGPAGDGPTFTYLPAPSVTSISPSEGPAAGGTRVTIQGTGFSPGAGAGRGATAGGITVTFGSTPATGVSCSSATKCTATSPPGMGTVSVRVTVDGQTSADTPADDFTYVPAGSPGPPPGRR